MNEFIDKIIENKKWIFSGIGTCVFSLFFPRIKNCISTTRQNKSAGSTTTWHGRFQDITLDSTRKWEDETIALPDLRRNTKIHFTSKNDQGSTEYCNGKINKQSVFIGNWKEQAIKDHSRQRRSGNFFLKISPSKKYMYGFWSGKLENGNDVFGLWYLSINKTGLKDARQLLANSIGYPLSQQFSEKSDEKKQFI